MLPSVADETHGARHGSAKKSAAKTRNGLSLTGFIDIVFLNHYLSFFVVVVLFWLSFCYFLFIYIKMAILQTFIYY
jgi:hypothetical protein